MPRRNLTSGRKFSTTTSACAASFFMIATPSGFLRSCVMPRLLRWMFWKSGPSRSPPRPESPLVSSILITSAPQSASWRTQVGPARTRVRSTTLKRDSGSLLMRSIALLGLRHQEAQDVAGEHRGREEIEHRDQAEAVGEEAADQRRERRQNRLDGEQRAGDRG